MRISVLWSSLANYSVSFFRELAISQNCTIQIVYYGPTAEAAYKGFDLSFCKSSINRSEHPHANIMQAVLDFSPDCILMSSWNYSDYMKISRKLRPKGVFVVSTIDHQWMATMKQLLGTISSRWFLKPCIDCFLVAGDRQANFARKLGYKNNILYGLYAAAIDEFKTTIPLSERHPSFLFAGRLTKEKGIENLSSAYRVYREQCESPWDLKIAGTGNLDALFKDQPGVQIYGFVQPEELATLMKAARTLILPSNLEPWGVVIHEAAAAGLPIIATYECGAVTGFVRDGVNGIIIETDTNAIKNAMLRITKYKSDQLQSFGDASRQLAALWSPKKLSHYFVENVTLKKDKTKLITNYLKIN